MPKKKAEEIDTTLGVLTHILAIFSSFLAPLLILLLAEDKFSRNNAREALNWQISLLIYMFVVGAVAIFLVLTIVGILLLPLLLLVVVVLYVIDIVFSVLAAIKASKGIVWRYPGSITFLSKE